MYDYTLLVINIYKNEYTFSLMIFATCFILVGILMSLYTLPSVILAGPSTTDHISERYKNHLLFFSLRRRKRLEKDII